MGNRDGREESKTIESMKAKGIKWFTPDCIVHKRGHSINKLIIECKCSTNLVKKSWDRDHEKLKATTMPNELFKSGALCNYDLGLFIEFTAGQQSLAAAGQYQAVCTWYVNGAAVETPKKCLFHIQDQALGMPSDFAFCLPGAYCKIFRI